MKTLTCDLCTVTAQGETFEDWMEALKPHYMTAHADVMQDPTKTPADMQKWLADNRTRFEQEKDAQPESVA